MYGDSFAHWAFCAANVELGTARPRVRVPPPDPPDPWDPPDPPDPPELQPASASAAVTAAAAMAAVRFNLNIVVLPLLCAQPVIGPSEEDCSAIPSRRKVLGRPTSSRRFAFAAHAAAGRVADRECPDPPPGRHYLGWMFQR